MSAAKLGLTVNGKSYELEGPATVSDLLARLDLPKAAVAVERSAT